MAKDYYPFGMVMPGRSYSANSQYRYGFNGKENDKDISEGVQDYGMRIYDTRLGRFLSVDPLAPSFPGLTPYQFAGNTPVQAIDLDGSEPLGFMEYWNAKTNPYMTKWGYTVQDFYDYETKQVWTVMHYPNTNEYQYWKPKYVQGQKLFTPYNTNLNRQDGEWTGSFKLFTPLHLSNDRSFDYVMAGLIVGIPALVVAGLAAATVSMETAGSYLLGKAASLYLAYWRWAPLAGVAGRTVASWLDETGTISGANSRAALFSKLTVDEQMVTKTLIEAGRSVELLPTNVKQKTTDFLIDGISTELKTLTAGEFNLNTAVTKITEAFKQGKNVILNARQYDLSSEQVGEIVNRVKGTYSNKSLPGAVEIWTQSGQYKY